MGRDSKTLHKRHEALMDDFWVFPEVGVELQWGTKSVAKSKEQRDLQGSYPAVFTEGIIYLIFWCCLWLPMNLSTWVQQAVFLLPPPQIPSEIPAVAMGSSLPRVNYRWNLYLHSLAKVFPQEVWADPPRSKTQSIGKAENQA